MGAILALLPSLISGGKTLWDLYAHIRDTMKQSGEWNSANEAEFQKLLADAGTKPEWQPDAAPPS